METIEFKKLSLDFLENLGELVSDVEDVEDNEISDKDEKAICYRSSKNKA